MAHADVIAFVPDAFDGEQAFLFSSDGDFVVFTKGKFASQGRNAEVTDRAEEFALPLIVGVGDRSHDQGAFLVAGFAFYEAIPLDSGGAGNLARADPLFFAELGDRDIAGFQELHFEGGFAALLLSNVYVVVTFDGRPAASGFLKKLLDIHE